MPVTRIDKDLDAHTMTVVAEYDAAVERVWQLYADPRQLERFWGPADLAGHRRRPRPAPRRSRHLLHEWTRW